jgi:flagellar L-ring protein precursor FlgH
MILTILIGVAGLSACSSFGARRDPPWPATSEPARNRDKVEASHTSTSLWNPNATMTLAYDDHRARRIGDLVTVVVTETSEASREASTDLGRSSSVDVGVDAMLGMPMHMGLPGLYKGGNDFSPNVSASTGNSFSGSGATKRKETLKTRIAARVMEILEDGNMLVEGRRQVEVNDEIQYLYVRGIARPVDISPDNMILSTSLADADIIYSGTGAVSGEQKPGWGYRLLSAVWPF